MSSSSRDSRSGNWRAKRRHAAQRHFRPRVEILEQRCLLAISAFVEDFTDDADPTRGGYDSGIDGFEFRHFFSGLGFGNVDVAPHREALLMNFPGDSPLPLIDEITFSGDNAPDGAVHFATLNFLFPFEPPFGNSRVVFVSNVESQPPRSVSVPIELETSGISRVSISSNRLLDDSQRLGPITSIQIVAEQIFFVDDVNVLVEVLPPNNPPFAQDDEELVARDTHTFINVLDNDFDHDNDLLFLDSFTQPAHGSVVRYGSGVEYQPSVGFSGVDQFEYVMADSRGGTSTATVTVTVNSPPSAFLYIFERPHGSTGSLVVAAPGLLERYHDDEGDAVLPAIVDDPSHGTLDLRPDGSFLYTSTAPGGLLWTDSFTYRLKDGHAYSNVADVRINVPNEAPVASSDLAHYRHHETTIRGNLFNLVQDADFDLLTIERIADPRSGLLTVQPNGEFVYERQRPALHDSFEFVVSDGYAQSNVGRIEFVWLNQLPQPEDDRFLVPAGTTRVPGRTSTGVLLGSILANDLDPDGDPLEAMVYRSPEQGNLVLNPDGSFVYESSVPVFQRDTFTYRLFDGMEWSEEATVTLIQDVGEPRLRSDSYTVALGTGPLGHAKLDVLGGPTLLVNDSFSTGIPLQAPLRAVAISDRSPGLIVSPTYGTYSVGIAPLPGGLDHLIEIHNVVVPPNERIEDDGGFVFYTLQTGITEFHYRIDYRTFDQAPGAAPHQSDYVSVLIAVTNGPEADSDGVPDSVEGGRLDGTGGDRSGDRNGDSIGDGIQPHVAALPNAVTGEYVVLQSELGARLFGVSASVPASPLPSGVVLPLGSFDFFVTGLTPGGATNVTMILPPGVHPSTYFKFGRRHFDDPDTPQDETQPHWYEFLYNGHTGAQMMDSDFDGLTDRIALHFVDGARGDEGGILDGVIRDPGGPVIQLSPQVASVTINDGSAQRSMIASLSVLFNDLVTVDPGAFELWKTGVSRPLDVTVALAEQDGQTVARLSFRGAHTFAGSLTDGNYRLIIRDDAISGAHGKLDGDGDGLAGGNHVDEFFRLFGDGDGDGDVDWRDAASFATTLGKRSRDAGYIWYFDFNSNDRVSIDDLARFVLGLIRN